MILTADYHTHTTYSHGKGTVAENAAVAEAKGLKEIAVSDHGFSHPAFGITAKKVPVMRADVDGVNECVRPRVLLGIESNLRGENGKVDLKEKFYPYFDVFLVGFHKFILYDGIPNWFNFFARNYFTTVFHGKPDKSLIRLNTKAYIAAIEKNPLDVITHLNFCVFADAAEVAKAARDNGVYLELNAKKGHLTDDELDKVVQTGVQFVIGSDAHTPDRVGEISRVEELLRRVSVPKEQICNIDGKLPDFRFARYKREHGIEREL